MPTYKTPGGQAPSLYLDMIKQPHCLIAGASGSGKSVVINGLISALVRKCSPATAELLLIDPKMVELDAWAALPHTVAHVTEPDEITRALQRTIDVIERRYRQAQAEGKRLYDGPALYVVIDELADLMLTIKACRPLLQRILQIGRAARVHVIAATQCPLASVIPTAIKCNFSAILGLHTFTAQDSRNILSVTGLERLPMYGKAVYKSPGRELIDCTIRMTTDDEIFSLVKYWSSPAARIA